MSETERVVAILGGGQALGRSAPKTEFELIALVRKGVPYRALAKAKAALDVTTDDLSRFLISRRGPSPADAANSG